MPRAIFSEPFNFSSRTSNAGWAVKPSAEPQTFPRELIDAAVDAGVAEIVKPSRQGKSSKEAANG